MNRVYSTLGAAPDAITQLKDSCEFILNKITQSTKELGDTARELEQTTEQLESALKNVRHTDQEYARGTIKMVRLSMKQSNVIN
jgi:ABC-type transporter Mla subunit MlaD